MPQKKLLVKDLSKPKILADENIELSLVKSLKSKGFDIKYAEKGLKNSELVSFVIKEDRILLTHDHDFLNVEMYKPTVGILVLQVYPSISEMEEILVKFLNEFNVEDVKGKVFLLTKEKVIVFED